MWYDPVTQHSRALRERGDLISSVEARTPAVAGPERLVGQGLDANQEESGNRAIRLLLTHPIVGSQVHVVATYRDGAYEVWAKGGMIRFERTHGTGGEYDYRVIETVGENPIENQDERAVATLEEELEAARRSGHPTDEPNEAYIEPEELSYPLAYQRIAQLFDSPNAPDLVINPKCFAYGKQPGQHGTLDIVQSRAPLIFSGPGVRSGVSETAARHVDIAPTIARLMDFPKIAGRDAMGRPSNDVYFRRQDGHPLEEILDLDAQGSLRLRPERVYLFLMDGQSSSELHWRLQHEPEKIPNLRRLIKRGHDFKYGSIVNFPSITWCSHNTIGTGCWGGHHDVVNNTYYLRETRERTSPYDLKFDTGRFLGDQVETLYEAFHRVYGRWNGNDGAFTAAIHEPCGRDADHAVLEGRIIGDRERLRALTKESLDDVSPRWLEDGQQKMHDESTIDNRGIAQVCVLYTEDTHPPPIFTYHNFMLTDGTGHDYGPHHSGQRTALEETDRRIGRVLSMMEDEGLFESTLFIIVADHGMAPTDTSLRANQGQVLLDEGMKAVVTAPFVYLLDMAVAVDLSTGGTTATVAVHANDADSLGQRPPIAGAQVIVQVNERELARATTDASGQATVSLPDNEPPETVTIAVEHEDYNPRHLRLDGSNAIEDLRRLLYRHS